jgi:bifunctional DNA-binding transcriptional regulator/antitoxin component of YhaV-PrlF toxin-antitoxin module
MQAVATPEFLALVPASIREKLKLRPGTVLDFDEQAPFLKAVPAKTVEEAQSEFDAWLTRSVGMSDCGLSTEQILNETRGED